jgi:hypothetical protein
LLKKGKKEEHTVEPATSLKGKEGVFGIWNFIGNPWNLGVKISGSECRVRIRSFSGRRRRRPRIGRVGVVQAAAALIAHR